MAVGSGPSKLLVGGFRPADPSFEQYWVRPGWRDGAWRCAPDDRFTVIDVGRRPGGRAHDAGPGRNATTAAAIGARRRRAATVVRSARLPRSSTAPRRSSRDLAGRGRTRAARWRVRLFGEWSPPGVRAVVPRRAGGRAHRGRTGRPRRRRRPAAERPRRRGRTGRSRGRRRRSSSPPPLAEPRLDFRIDRSTARSYEVQAGEFIQVIDVEGKQCSDFLAFHRRKLDDGIERGLDATVTRDADGRARTRRPGCSGSSTTPTWIRSSRSSGTRWAGTTPSRSPATPKYYEDMGYPGHVNCTDNFNGHARPSTGSPSGRAGRR